MKNKINKKIKVLVFIFLFAIIGFFPSQKPAQAVDCWFIPCDGIFEQAMDMIKSALLAILKEEGASMISDSVGGAAKYVKNTNEFLESDPTKAVNKEFDKYLKEGIAQGKSSASSYVNIAQINSKNANAYASNFEGVGPDSFRIGLYKNNPQIESFIESASAASTSGSMTSSAGNYLNKMVEDAKKATINKVEPAVTYAGDPSKMFESGNFKNLNTYASGINNPWAFQSNATAVYEKKLTTAKEQAKTEYIAGQGFLPTKDSKGNIKTPAITTKDIVSKSKTVGNDVLANAQDIPTAMISMIATMAAGTIKDGIESKQETKDNSSKKNDLQGQMDDLMGDSQEFDLMGSMDIEDFLLPSLFRTLNGD
jgi:hypothetical protein